MLSHASLSDRALSAGEDETSLSPFGAIIGWVNLIPTYLARPKLMPTFFSFVRTEP